MRLKGFDKYKGGLDTVHDLTGKGYLNHLSFNKGLLTVRFTLLAKMIKYRFLH